MNISDLSPASQTHSFFKSPPLFYFSVSKVHWTLAWTAPFLPFHLFTANVSYFLQLIRERQTDRQKERKRETDRQRQTDRQNWCMHLVHKNCSTQLFPWLLLTSKSRVPRETTALRRLSCTSHNRYFIYSATLFPKSSKQHAVENLGLLHLMPKPCCNSTTLQALVNNNKIQHLFGLHKTGCQWRQPYQAPWHWN